MVNKQHPAVHKDIEAEAIEFLYKGEILLKNVKAFGENGEIEREDAINNTAIHVIMGILGGILGGTVIGIIPIVIMACCKITNSRGVGCGGGSVLGFVLLFILLTIISACVEAGMGQAGMMVVWLTCVVAGVTCGWWLTESVTEKIYPSSFYANVP